MSYDQYPDIEPLYEQAKEFASAEVSMSISKMQQRFKIGYNRAARLCEKLAEDGVLIYNRDTGAWRSAPNG